MLIRMANRGSGAALQPLADLTTFNLPQRWGMTGGTGPQPGSDAVAQAEGSKYIFVNNAGGINSPHLVTYQLGTVDPPPTRRVWTLRYIATLTHAFEGVPVIPYIGDGTVEWTLVASNGNQYRTSPNMQIQGFPGESLGFVWVAVTQVIDTATDFFAGGGVPNTMSLVFAHTGFAPGFLVDRLLLTGV